MRVFDDGQGIFPAQPIGGLPHEGVGGVVVVIPLAVHKGYGVQHKMVMQMMLVKMGGNHHLKAVAPKLLCQLYADGVGGFGGGFPRSEGLVAVEGKDTIRFLELQLCPGHLLTGGDRVAVDAGDVKLLFGLGILLGIFQHVPQALKIGT